MPSALGTKLGSWSPIMCQIKVEFSHSAIAVRRRLEEGQYGRRETRDGLGSGTSIWE